MLNISLWILLFWADIFSIVMIWYIYVFYDFFFPNFLVSYKYMNKSTMVNFIYLWKEAK
jgi:hypothetical protein